MSNLKTAAIEPLLVNVDTACALLGVGRSKLYQLVGEGSIDVVHVGRSVRLTMASLRAFTARLEANG